MNFEIERKNWTNFFDDLGRRRFEWITKIEVLKNEIGDQLLTEGLVFNGITVDTKDDRVSISIFVGDDVDAHQTHNIQNPVRVAFLAADDDHGDVINIEEADGTKTLITFVEPMGILVGYTGVQMLATAG